MEGWRFQSNSKKNLNYKIVTTYKGKIGPVVINQDLSVLSYLVRCEWLRGKKKKITIQEPVRVGAQRGLWPRARDGVTVREDKEMKRENSGLSGFRVTSQRQANGCVFNLIWDTQQWQMWVWVKESVIVWRLIQKWHSTMCTHTLTRILYTQWRSLWWDVHSKHPAVSSDLLYWHEHNWVQYRLYKFYNE